MRRMGVEALYRRPNTSKPHPGHRIYPYLLRGLAIERANRVWAMDITYVPIARGFVYLAAVMDWYSRKVLAWDVSISMESDFCVRVLDQALARHGRGGQFRMSSGGQFWISLDTRYRTSPSRLGAEEVNRAKLSPVCKPWSRQLESSPGPRRAGMAAEPSARQGNI